MVRRPFYFSCCLPKNYAVKLWGDWDDGNPIADPYYGGVVGQLAYSSFAFQYLPSDRVVSKPALNNAKDIRMLFSMRWSQNAKRAKALCNGTH